MRDAIRSFVIFVVAVFVIIFGFSFIRNSLFRSSTRTNVQSKPLTDYIDRDSYVELTIMGRVTADENHRVIKISVASNERVFVVLTGYQNNILKFQRYDNNSAAYNDFMHALSLSGFTRTRRTANTNAAGVCPFGQRYIYDLYDASERVQNLWSASCGGVGTSGANKVNVNRLFQSQIPDYDKLTSDVRL